MTTASNVVRAEGVSGLRWGFLAICVVCMIMIANLQYGWTLFVNPINKAHGWSIASIQVAFSIFIALETWLTPIQGWIVDVLGPQRGPKLMVGFGGITVAIGWMINAYATSLEMLYLGAIVSGAGGGAVYATCVGNAVKWFPDRRGLAVGLTAAGYGAGAALTVIPIRYVIDNYGYNAAFLWFGIVQGAVVFVLALALRGPEPSEMAAAPPPKVVQSARSFSPEEVLLTPVFWLLYLMFVMVSASGLMATAQIAPIAADFKVVDQIVFWGATTLTAALIIDNIANGTARPLFGWISDNIGRELTMALAFGLGGIASGSWEYLERHRGPLCRRPHIPDLGRDLQPISFHVHRYVRPEICNGELEPALHGEGNFGVPRSDRKCRQVVDRELAHGVCSYRPDEFRGGRTCLVCAQAAAAADARRRLSFETAPPG
jgi:MFS transporter, OFA family, oxalate/formate antiporter